MSAFEVIQRVFICFYFPKYGVGTVHSELYRDQGSISKACLKPPAALLENASSFMDIYGISWNIEMIYLFAKPKALERH